MSDKINQLKKMIDELLVGHAVVQAAIQELGNTTAAIEIQKIRTDVKKRLSDIDKGDTIEVVTEKSKIPVKKANTAT
jgi:hypothetical protein